MIMKNKLQLILFVLSGFFFLPSRINAQQQQADFGKYGKDSVNCIQNLSLYRDYLDQKMYDEAHKFWKIAYTICPASSEQMYADGADLMEYKIKNAKNDELKAAYLDTLLQIYDRRIQYFGKEGYLLGRKGTDMLRYMPDSATRIFDVLGKSIELQEKQSEAGALVAYFTTAVMLEKADKIGSEEIVEVFEESNEIISYNLEKYKGKTLEKYYQMAQDRISELAAPYLSCEILVEVTNKNFEAKKNDADWLERSANLLESKGCTSGETFYKIALELHKLNPTATSSEKMGITSLKAKKYTEALKYFTKALELESEEGKKADYYVELAQTYSGMGRYADARSSARKAVEIRPDYGLPYILIGDLYASSTNCGENACMQKAVYWLAVDYYAKAKAVDPSIASTANSKISTYSKYFPTTQDCFFAGITEEGQTVQIGCWINESTKARFN